MEYRNPVYPENFPDPFVLKYRGVYWAYATGIWRDGRCFGILRSSNLVSWEEIGGAMEPLPEGWPHYWAPEVMYENGRFYLYYSAGDELNTMHIRVAVSQSPAGPFVDSGRALTHEPFAIDAHVFVDSDGTRHLFYATDYLEHTHIGTGTARDQMIDPLTTMGRPSPVTRARYDWQIYDPKRVEKGGVRWHTVEGPFVLRRKGRYYQMFSAGNWQHPGYGVSYATAERIDETGEWAQHADGEKLLPILRSVPDKVIGPGHNSVVRGPDNRQLFCVYHRWDLKAGARVMAVDKLDWAGDRLFILGPNTTPQPITLPTFSDHFDRDDAGGLGPAWVCRSGTWHTDHTAHQTDKAGEAAAELAGFSLESGMYLIEITLCGLGTAMGQGRFGVAVGSQFRCMIEQGEGRAAAVIHHGPQQTSLSLPPEFDPQSDHLLRIELNAGNLSVRLDEACATWSGRLVAAAGGRLALITDGMAAAFRSIEITEGWEDLFCEPGQTPVGLGWRCTDEMQQSWQIKSQELVGAGEPISIFKGPLPKAYELVVALRLLEGQPGSYAILPAVQPNSLGPMIALEQVGQTWGLRCTQADFKRRFMLPKFFNPYQAQQLRFEAKAGQLAISYHTELIGRLPAPGGATHVGLIVEQGKVAYDMVRITALPE
jgi:GH43 family beta-xylosidase